jgi:RNA polymerase sigma-70 factor, ECF subfamily
MTDRGEERERLVSGALRVLAAGGAQATSALGELYRELRRPLLVYLLRKGLTPAAAEDALHEVFLNVARSAAQCRHGGTATAWVWRIASNAANDVHRDGMRVVAMDAEEQQALAEAQPAPACETPAGAIDDCVERALQRFARQHPERADALRLLHIERWSGEQLAAWLGRTPGAAREYLSQCRRIFRPFVEPCRELLAA